ncbi:MAG: HAMP domain-containing histidine kinase [Deltaproteobacteria bacterium]|nr:HAMP domain-containing histidine kinase [Deltaproteobacteria bacterium]
MDTAEAFGPALQAQFELETRRLMRRRAVVACVLVLCIAPFYMVADYMLYATDFATLTAWRLVCVLLTSAILAAVRGPLGERHPDWLVLLLGIVVGCMFAAVPALMEGYDTPYFVALTLLILGLPIFMPCRAGDVLLLSGVLLFAYVAAALMHGRIHNPAVFLTNVSLLVTSGAVALVGMRIGAAMRRTEFLARHQLEDAVRDKSAMAAVLEQQSARLALANQEMEDLLYVASHDLRAPLINVQGFTRELQLSLDELRRESPASPETRAVSGDIDESIQFILAAVSRMDGLIGSLLNVSRIATRTNPTEAVSLGPMVETIIDTFRYQLDQKQITISVGDLPAVIGDPLRLNQAFSNLVDNAIKYMGERAVRRIEIGAQSADDTCTCFVRDTGPGIPKGKQEAVFRLFHRLPNGGVPGEGIGLTMVRKIVEKHGGRIWLESVPDEGSTFWFTLRLAAAARTMGAEHDAST